MIPPTSIDGTDITGATIDGTDVTEITVDGDTVFQAREVPVVEYLIDEGSGTTLNNNVGSSFDATSSGSPIWVSDTSVRGDAYVENLTVSNSFEIDNSTTGLMSANNDWTIGLELNSSSGLPNKTTIFAWGDTATNQFSLGKPFDASSSIAINHIQSDSRIEKVSGPEPSPPYTLDIVVQYDESTGELKLFFDGIEQTGSASTIRAGEVPMTIGIPDDPPGTFSENASGPPGGIAAFAFWDKIVQPSEFDKVG